MCNHKPKFFKYYFFAHRHVKKPSNIQKEGYVCKHCGEKIHMDEKYLSCEFLFRLLGHSVLSLPLLFSFWSYYSDNMNARIPILLVASTVFFILHITANFLFYLVVKFKKIE